MTTLLPPNATASELALEGATARLSGVPVPITSLWDPETCPVDHLPWLAWAFSVDNWSPDWPETVKRQVIAASFDVHRVKGAIGALERALEALDLGYVEVIEWFNKSGAPGTFSVDVTLLNRGLTDVEEASISAAIEGAKNLRSHLDQLNIWLTSKSASPRVGALAVTGEVIEVEPHSIAEVTGENAMPVIAAGAVIVETVAVNPEAGARS